MTQLGIQEAPEIQGGVIIKKCGNCNHLKPEGILEKQMTFLKELAAGKCEYTGKHMSGALIAGCYYWRERERERVLKEEINKCK